MHISWAYTKNGNVCKLSCEGDLDTATDLTFKCTIENEWGQVVVEHKSKIYEQVRKIFKDYTTCKQPNVPGNPF